MAFLLLILNMAGTVALLLWGVRMVQTGIQRAFGPRLGLFLATALGNRVTAFLAGLGVTAILQSSTATALMVSGFAAGGMIALVPGLAVMLGANVGTTLIVQALSFDIAAAAPALVLAGFVMFQRAPTGRMRDLGRVGIGLGLILLALHMLLVFITPLETAPKLRALLDLSLQEPVVALLLAAGLTWAAHSSVAVVLLVAALAANGLLHVDAAAILVLGANLGTAINPVLESRGAGDPAARRLPVGSLLIRLAGCVAGLAVLSVAAPPLASLGADPARAVANIHTLFNLLLAAVFLPLLTPCARLLERLFPPAGAAQDPGRPRYLADAASAAPPVAIGAAAREALHMADVLEAMLAQARDGLAAADRHAAAAVRRSDATLERLGQAIGLHLSGLDHAAMTEADERRIVQVLTFTRNLAHAGEVIGRNLMRLGKRDIALPDAARREIVALLDRLAANLRTAVAAFMEDDARAARLLAAEKEVFRSIEERATDAWFARLRRRDTAGPDGSGDAIWLEAPWLDALRDIKQVNAHLVAAAAYPVLKQAGGLLPTRLAPQTEEAG